MRNTMKQSRWTKIQFVILPALLIAALSSCSNPSREAELAREMLGIELQQSSGNLQQLSDQEQQRMKDLEKELLKISKRLQNAIVEGSKLANRQQAVGLIYLKYGMYLQALQAFDNAIQVQGNNPSLFYYRGLIYSLMMKNTNQDSLQEDYLSKAEHDYQRSLDIKDSYEDSLYGLGVLKLFERQDYAAAANLFDRYIANRKISRSAARSPQPNRSLREAQRRAKEEGAPVGSKDINALFMRAQAAYGLGNLDEAASFYDWIIQSSWQPQIKEEAQKLKNSVLSEKGFQGAR